MAYITTRHLLSYSDACARNSILDKHKNQGESKQSIENIQREINILANTQYKIDSIVPNYLDRLLHVERTRSHHIVSVIEHDDFKASIHFIPSRYEIRGHLHRDSINIIHLQQGCDLQIEQRSLSNQENTVTSTLQENQSCAGLLKLRNIHHIKSSDSPCVFISFRITKQSPHTYTIKKIFSVLTSSALFLLPNVMPEKSDACEKVLLYSSHHTLNTKTPNNSKQKCSTCQSATW